MGVSAYCHNWVDHDNYSVKASEALTSGRHTIRFGFDYDGVGPGKGCGPRLLVDSTVVAKGRIENTYGYMYATTDGLDIGRDTGALMINGYGTERVICTAVLHRVTIDINPAAHPDPEGLARAKVATATQRRRATELTDTLVRCCALG